MRGKKSSLSIHERFILHFFQWISWYISKLVWKICSGIRLIRFSSSTQWSSHIGKQLIGGKYWISAVNNHVNITQSYCISSEYSTQAIWTVIMIVIRSFYGASASFCITFYNCVKKSNSFSRYFILCSTEESKSHWFEIEMPAPVEYWSKNAIHNCFAFLKPSRNRKMVADVKLSYI